MCTVASLVSAACGLVEDFDSRTVPNALNFRTSSSFDDKRHVEEQHGVDPAVGAVIDRIGDDRAALGANHVLEGGRRLLDVLDLDVERHLSRAAACRPRS